MCLSFLWYLKILHITNTTLRGVINPVEDRSTKQCKHDEFREKHSRFNAMLSHEWDISNAHPPRCKCTGLRAQRPSLLSRERWIRWTSFWPFCPWQWSQQLQESFADTAFRFLSLRSWRSVTRRWNGLFKTRWGELLSMSRPQSPITISLILSTPTHINITVVTVYDAVHLAYHHLPSSRFTLSGVRGRREVFIGAVKWHLHHHHQPAGGFWHRTIQVIPVFESEWFCLPPAS